MYHHTTIEDRLEAFDLKGKTCGFTLKLWSSKAKSLEKRGIILRNPQPTERKGEALYEIDFSLPLPGSYAEELYNIAQKNRPADQEENWTEPEPLHPPYGD